MNVAELHKMMYEDVWDGYELKDDGMKDDGGEDLMCEPCGDGDEKTMMAEIMSFVRKGKGKGKGGGKGGKGFGKFEGECSHCGKYGHRKRDCWELDKLMGDFRAGKGNGIKSGGKEKETKEKEII